MTQVLSYSDTDLFQVENKKELLLIRNKKNRSS